MNARAREFELLPATMLATAAILGVVTALQPLLGLAAAVGIVSPTSCSTTSRGLGRSWRC